tara:strand:+ start:346 stop:525 length:180 start_codon:yes stop_codon:yes gene_type:complete
MKYKEVINAINKGKSVYWSNDNYRVIKDNIGQYLIHSYYNDFYIGFDDDDYYLKDCYTK